MDLKSVIAGKVVTRFNKSLLVAIVAGTCGAVGEVLPLGVDDNLSAPVASGTMFMMVRAAYLWNNTAFANV